MELADRMQRDPELVNNFEFDTCDDVDDLCLIDQMQIADVEYETDDELPHGGMEVEDKENTYLQTNDKPTAQTRLKPNSVTTNNSNAGPTEDKENSCGTRGVQDKENPCAPVAEPGRCNYVNNVRPAQSHEWGAVAGQEIVWKTQPAAVWQVADQICNSPHPATKQNGRGEREGAGGNSAVRGDKGGADDARSRRHTVGDCNSQDSERHVKASARPEEHERGNTEDDEGTVGDSAGGESGERSAATAATGPQAAGEPRGAHCVLEGRDHQPAANHQQAGPGGNYLRPGAVQGRGLQHGDVCPRGEPRRGGSEGRESRNKDTEKEHEGEETGNAEGINGDRIDGEGRGGGPTGCSKQTPVVARQVTTVPRHFKKKWLIAHHRQTRCGVTRPATKIWRA